MLMGAMLSPTDPVLASAIIKGRFAETHVPLQLRTLLAAESGANDGCALPLLALSALLISAPDKIISGMLVDVLLRKIILALVIGCSLGYGARKALRAAEQARLIDKESMIAFHFALALATLGLTTMLGTSDMLAVFVLGVAFSWDGWWEERVSGAEFQAVIDSLFTLSFFVLFGAATPWTAFALLGYARLVVLAVAVLLIRRVPATLILSPLISQLKGPREALFAGWFGPIGVGALFYAWACQLEGERRTLFNPTITHIVWFMVLASILVHGATVPAFHIGSVRQIVSLLPEDEDEALEVLTTLLTEDSLSDRLSISPSVIYEEQELVELGESTRLSEVVVVPACEHPR